MERQKEEREVKMKKEKNKGTRARYGNGRKRSGGEKECRDEGATESLMCLGLVRSDREGKVTPKVNIIY